MAKYFLMLLLFFSLIAKGQKDSISQVSNWQLNATYLVGGNFFTKDIHKNYTNQFCTGITFDVYYKKLLLGFRDQIGFGKTNRDFIYDSINLPRKSGFRSLLLGTDFGYVVLNNDRRKITPFVGVNTFVTIQPLFRKSSTPHSEKFELPFTLTFSFGFNYDIKLRLPEWKMIDGDPQKVSEYRFIRLKNVFYLPQFQKKTPGFTGEIYCLTLEYGID